MDLGNLKNKKILILGLGREGADSLKFFLENLGQNEIGVADKMEFEQLNSEIKEILDQNPQIKRFLGTNYLVSLANYDAIVKTPGIPIHIPEIEQAYSQNKITSQTEIFLNLCPGTVIGITGTKGKSTTAAITYEILKAGGEKVDLVGNIGTSMLSFLKTANKDSFFVCEFSCHQLYNLKKSPHIAVLLNLYPEHLDYYKDFSEYIRSKANITLFQTKNDYLIYNSTNSEVNAIAQESKAQRIAFNEYKWDFLGKTNLIGKHNLENAKIGAIIAKIFGIKDEIINQVITEFKPLDNRLEFVGNFKGIDCYNDSLSTIQESAVAAIEGLGERVQTLISGGLDRNQPFDKLASAILVSKIKNLILFPTTGKLIWEETQKQARILGKEGNLAQLNHFFVENMEEAVKIALENTNIGKICLLSSASASYNQFRDYADRGNYFKKCLLNHLNG